MGINNRQRRAAKRRKRTKARSGPAGPQQGRPWGGHDAGYVDDRAITRLAVLQALSEVESDPAAARRQAELLTRADIALSPVVVVTTVRELLTEVLVAALAGGWTPSDLGEIVRRRLSTRALPVLAALLGAEADRHPGDRVDGRWRDELAALGTPTTPDLRSIDGLEAALGLCAVLTQLPMVTQILPPPGSAAGARGAVPADDAKRLARARALLAKAESTEYDEEAEAMSAKAQWLISRYALDRLMRQGSGEPEADAVVTARRLWIDPPYVLAKAMLIDAVARANRCRTVVTDGLGFSTVIGEPVDLDAVELMATSLLAQAGSAVRRCGRHADWRGTSRTTSFRRSFLVAYASRIGERLSAATGQAVAETGHGGELLPVLRRREQLVDDACAQMFPQLESKAASISNAQGWAAGRAAADLALLDARPEMSDAASS